MRDESGTLNYMSPDQLVGEQVDHRTDIYSVGALAYELITNHMAYPGTTQTGVLFKILTSRPLPIASLVPGIDPDITAIIERAMAREPDARYQDLENLRQDVVVVRTRLIETASEIEEADQNAETQLASRRVPSGTLPRPSSRAGSTLFQSGGAIDARTPSQVAPPPRRSKPVMLLGVACGALVIALAATVMLTRSPASRPPAQTETGAQPQSQPQAPRPPTPRADAGLPESPDRATLEEELNAVRVGARQQIAAGQRQPALDTLVRGLALAPKDPELNALVDELTRVARRTATEARAAATLRGSSPRSAVAFRDGQAREREADRLLRADERVPAIRAFWAAASLYNKSPDVTAQTPSPAPAPPTRPSVESVAPPTAKPTSPTVLTPPSPPEAVKTVPAPVDTFTPTPATPTPEPPAAPRDPAPDRVDADLSAIRETLRRYTQAYQSLDSQAVGKMMPSLTPDQLRSLARDFANYRSYMVEIRDECIAVDGLTATVTCEVVRSFETRNGVAGSNSVESIFHLRRSGLGWTIMRLQSR